MKFFNALFLFLILGYSSMAQLLKEGGSAVYENSPSEEIAIPIDDSHINRLVEAQNRSENQRVMFPVGTLIPVAYNLMESAKWSYLPGGDRIGKLTIQANGATGLGVYFEDFFLPLGSELFAYSDKASEMLGPFTFADNTQSGKFSSGTVKGDKITLEIHLPSTVQSLPELKISHMGYQLDPNQSNGSRDFGDSEDCQVNANCSEGDNWDDQKKAVVRIKMLINGFEGWCSGTVMNNSLQDCTPYILTADHCRHADGGVVATDQEYKSWEFYFLYESSGCSDPRNEGQITVSKMTGCTKRAASAYAGDGDSDFLLLELDNSIPQFYTAFFAGWNRNNIPANSGVMLHHPAGDIKKISTSTRQMESSEWDANLALNTHWKTYWSSTTNGHGVSEGGSSGSALWNQNGHVVGQLTGGSSACEEGTGKGPFNPDYFGKLSYSWFWGGSDSAKNLEYWLDYGRSGLKVIDGIHWPCSELPLQAEEVINTNTTIEVYPNPANEKLNIEVDNAGFDDVHLLIRDALGRTMYESYAARNNIEIECADWDSGVYILMLQVNGQVQTEKIIIE